MGNTRSHTERRKRKRAKMLSVQDGKCFHCNEDISQGEVTLDHLIPQSAGGTQIDSVAACRDCNEGRGDSSPTPWQLTKLKSLQILLEIT